MSSIARVRNCRLRPTLGAKPQKDTNGYAKRGVTLCLSGADSGWTDGVDVDQKIPQAENVIRRRRLLRIGFDSVGRSGEEFRSNGIEGYIHTNPSSVTFQCGVGQRLGIIEISTHHALVRIERAKFYESVITEYEGAGPSDVRPPNRSRVAL